MHDRVLDGHTPTCPSCPPSTGAGGGAGGGELRAPLPAVAEIGTLAEARAAIDGIDAALATLLEHRAAVAALVQRLKPVGGFAGRNPERERQIVEAMAERAPGLGAARLARIVNVIIETGLEAAEDARP